MRNTSFRKLTPEEITALTTQGCRAGDWSCVEVTAGFDAARVHGCVFEGAIRIGALDASAMPTQRVPGLHNCRLFNVSLGDNCSVSAVHGRIANADIGDRVVIENAGSIECTGPTTFGNGHVVNVLVEAGGRGIKLCTDASAQTAYLSVMYRHDRPLIEALERMAEAYADQSRRSRLTIGDGVCITDTQRIANVSIGPGASIDGAVSLREGTIESSVAAPSLVGPGVIAENFIMQKGAHVIDGSLIAGSLIGEGVRIGKQFSMENSLFFANSEGLLSEVNSIFAGPYTVTHHRSTLLIAGLFSFYNAGSGTNQSNHKYKLGPVHQGVCERGCKSGSSSYILWPCRVGAFSVIIGKHHANFDTSDLPFSVITEEDGKSRIVPGMSLFSVGLLRDGRKWPARDNRADEHRRDLITFDVLSPYTAQKMMRGTEILQHLGATSDESRQVVTYKRIQIVRSLLKNSARYYRCGLDIYFGDVFAQRARQFPAASLDELIPADSGPAPDASEWVDLCGLLCPQSRVTALCERIVAGELDTFAKIHATLTAIHASYRDDEWGWLLAAYRRYASATFSSQVPGILENWRKSSTMRYNMILTDATKEFEGLVRTGFGVDGSAEEDFTAVRGSFGDNPFVKSVEESIRDVQRTYEEMVGRFC